MSKRSGSKREVAMMFNAVKRRYGDRLSQQELEEVRKGVEGVVEALEALRSAKLDNGDGPFPEFVPYRKEG